MQLWEWGNTCHRSSTTKVLSGNYPSANPGLFWYITASSGNVFWCARQTVSLFVFVYAVSTTVFLLFIIGKLDDAGAYELI